MIFFLIGMPCSGKTTFGKAFATNLNCRFLDLDAEIMRLQGCTIAQIFENAGESGFRKIESETLRSLDFGASAVVATGGGAPCFYDNITFMRTRGTVLWLDPEMHVLKTRFLADSHNSRPLLQDTSADFDTKIAAMYEARKPLYRQAHYRLT